MKYRVSNALLSLLAVVTSASTLLTACGPLQTAAGPMSVPTKSTEPIKIALIGPLTGTNAVLGTWQKKGYELVIDENNAAGGIQGRKITVLTEDDEADPTKAVSLAQKVITQDKVGAANGVPQQHSDLGGLCQSLPRTRFHTYPPRSTLTSPRKAASTSFAQRRLCAAYADTLVDFFAAQGMKKMVPIC